MLVYQRLYILYTYYIYIYYMYHYLSSIESISYILFCEKLLHFSIFQVFQHSMLQERVSFITFCNLIHIYNYIHTHTYTRCKSNCQPSYEPTLPMVWGPLLTSSTNTCELKPIASQFINGSLPILSNISLGWNMIIYECHKSIAVSQHESAGYI